MCFSYSILYLPCKCHSNILHNCQVSANLLLGYFNLGPPCIPVNTVIAEIFGFKLILQETQQSLTNRTTRLEVSQGHQMIRYARYGLLLVHVL